MSCRPTVKGEDICWPLGRAAADTPASMCRVRRSAWLLDGTVPPTLPDRVKSASLRETAWVDTANTRRLRPGCAPDDGVRWVALEYARWPTLLEPWLDPQWKSDAERLPLTPPCRAATPTRALRLTGIETGSVIRPAPGQHAAVVRVQAVGAREGVNWLLDGRLVGSGQAEQSLRLKLDQPGEHALTAIDGQGRYDRVAFTLKGP